MVITDRAVDACFQPRFEQVVLGDVVVRGTDLDGGLVEELLACSKATPDFPTLVGHTMCTYDFYEGKTCFGCPSPELSVQPVLRAAAVPRCVRVSSERSAPLERPLQIPALSQAKSSSADRMCVHLAPRYIRSVTRMAGTAVGGGGAMGELGGCYLAQLWHGSVGG